MNAALVISPRDNVATALESLDAGRTLAAGGATVVVAETIPRGHKLALPPDSRQSEAVVKYGSPIGTAAADMRLRRAVHYHNLASARGARRSRRQPT